MRSMIFLVLSAFSFNVNATSPLLATAEVTCGPETHELYPNGAVYTRTAEDVVVLAGVSYASWYYSGTREGDLIVVLNGQSFSDALIEYDGPLYEEFTIPVGAKLVFEFSASDLVSDRFVSVSYNPSSSEFSSINTESSCSFEWLY